MMQALQLAAGGGSLGEERPGKDISVCEKFHSEIEYGTF